MAEPVPFSYAQALLDKDPELKKRVDDLRRRRDLSPTLAPAPVPGVFGIPTALPDIVQPPGLSVSLEEAEEQAAGKRRSEAAIQRQGFAPEDTGIPPLEGTGEAQLSKPVQSALAKLEWYQQTIVDPFIGATQFNIQYLMPGEQFYERRIKELMATGLSAHEAFAQARRDYVATEQPGGKFVEIVQDVFLDPANVLPGIGFTKAPKFISKAPVRAATALSGEAGGLRLAKAAVEEAVETADSDLLKAIIDAPKAVGEEIVTSPTELGANVLNLQPIVGELNRIDELKSLVANTIGKPFNAVPDLPLATPAMRERARILPAIESSANGTGAKLDAVVKAAFPKGSIDNLAGIIDNLPGVPAISDLAARLPLYRPHLTTDQLNALETVRQGIAPYRALADEVGIDIATRSDIMEGGFYIPRGQAGKEGADEPLRIAGRRGGKPGSEKAAVFSSEAEGIAAGFEYAGLNNRLRHYIRDTGTRSLNAHVANYFKNLTDPETGLKIGQTSADRVSAALKTEITSLRNRIRGRIQALSAQIARESTLGKEATRAEKALTAAGGRVEAKSAVLGGVTPHDLADARKSLRQAITESRHLAYDIGKNAEQIENTGRVLLTQERTLVNLAEDLALANYASLARDASYATIIKDVAKLNAKIDKAATGADALGARVDDLIGQGVVLRDLSQDARNVAVEARRTERSLVARDREIYGAQRELRILEVEQNRLLHRAEKAGDRAAVATMRRNGTGEELLDLRTILDNINGDWQRALARAKDVPRGRALTQFPGLQGIDFPEEIVQVIEKQLSTEGALRGEGSFPLRIAKAYQSIYRFTNATADNSVLGIQGIVGMANDQKAWARAVNVNFWSWWGGGDGSLGRFLVNFDRATEAGGRMTQQQWAAEGIRIGGIETEFQLGTGITASLGKLPFIKQANRAFGFFGDALRLGWADDMLKVELKKRSLTQIKESGDLRRIAEVSNNMTGWAEGRAFGTLGDLLLFAPRFLQSRMETVLKGTLGLRPGASLDQRIARNSLIKMVGFGAAITYGVNWLMEEETDMRPIVDGRYNPNFMRMRVAGRDFSIYGPWDSLARAFVSTAAGNPQDVLRTLSGGLVSQAWDLISGEDFIGRDVRSDAGTFAEWLFRSWSPFAAEELPQAAGAIVKGIHEEDIGQIGAGLVTVGGEFFGAKSTPLSFTDIVNDEAQKLGYASFSAAPNRVKDEIRAVPEVQKKLEDFKPKLGSPQEQTTASMDQLALVQTSLETELRFKIDNGQQGAVLRKSIQEFKADRFKAGKFILSPEVEAVLAGDKAKPLEDQLRVAYMTAPLEEDPVTGVLDYRKRDQAREEVLRQADAAGIARELVMRPAKLDDPVVAQLIQEYDLDHDVLRLYWDLDVQAMIQVRASRADRAKWETERRLSTRNQSPMSRQIAAVTSGLRDRMFVQDRTIHALLVKWGYREEIPALPQVLTNP